MTTIIIMAASKEEEEEEEGVEEEGDEPLDLLYDELGVGEGDAAVQSTSEVSGHVLSVSIT